MDWQLLLGVAWVVLLWVVLVGLRPFGEWRSMGSDLIVYLALLGTMSVGIVLSFIRRERIEVYPDQMIWSKTYFGFKRSSSVRLAHIVAVEWIQDKHPDDTRKRFDHVEFYLTDGSSIRACFGFTFDEFEGMREVLRSMYPDLAKRWGTSTIRSKDLTLLNLS